MLKCMAREHSHRLYAVERSAWEWYLIWSVLGSVFYLLVEPKLLPTSKHSLSTCGSSPAWLLDVTYHPLLLHMSKFDLFKSSAWVMPNVISTHQCKIVSGPFPLILDSTLCWLLKPLGHRNPHSKACILLVFLWLCVRVCERLPWGWSLASVCSIV